MLIYLLALKGKTQNIHLPFFLPQKNKKTTYFGCTSVNVKINIQICTRDTI